MSPLLPPGSRLQFSSLYDTGRVSTIPLLVDFSSSVVTHALTLSASQFVHKKKSLDEFIRVCTRRDSNSRNWPTSGSRITWYATGTTGTSYVPVRDRNTHTSPLQEGELAMQHQTYWVRKSGTFTGQHLTQLRGERGRKNKKISRKKCGGNNVEKEHGRTWGGKRYPGRKETWVVPNEPRLNELLSKTDKTATKQIITDNTTQPASTWAPDSMVMPARTTACLTLS